MSRTSHVETTIAGGAAEEGSRRGDEALVTGDPPGVPERRCTAVATALAMTLAVVVSQTWFKPGSFIAQGDIPPFIRTAVKAEYPWAWNHELTGAGSPSFQVVRAFELLFLDAVELLGGSEVMAQRLYYAVLLASVAFGAARFAGRFTSNASAVALAAVFAFVNPFVLTQLPNPLVLAALGVMGVVGSLILGAAQGLRPRPLSLAVATVGMSYLLLNVVLVVVVAVWMLGLMVLGSALGGRGGTSRAFALAVRALPWAVVLNAWWIVPGAATFLADGAPAMDVSTDVRDWAWTHARGSLPNVLSLHAVWSWPFPAYFPYASALDAPAWDWLRFVVPSVCLSAPLVARGAMRRRALVLVGVMLAGALVGKGLHPPVSALNLWLYDHVPGFWLLREPIGKVGPVLVLVDAALIAIAATAAASRLRGVDDRTRRLAAGALAAVSAALLAFPYPLWNGGLFPDDRPTLPSPNVQLPAGWRAAADHLNAQPDRGKALVLPLADFYQVPTTWGYYGIDAIPRLLLTRPTIQPIPENYFGEMQPFIDIVRDVEEALVQGHSRVIPKHLQSLGVTHVLLRKDIDLTVRGRRIADPSTLRGTLSSTPGLELSRSFDVVDIYELGDASSGMVQIRPVREGRGRGGLPNGSLRWRRENPARYDITVSGAPSEFVVVLTEAYDTGWRLEGLPPGALLRRERVDGYANAWVVRGGGGDLRVVAEYRPAQRSRVALLGSLAGAGLAAGVAGFRSLQLAVRRRRPPTGSEDTQ